MGQDPRQPAGLPLAASLGLDVGQHSLHCQPSGTPLAFPCCLPQPRRGARAGDPRVSPQRSRLVPERRGSSPGPCRVPVGDMQQEHGEGTEFREGGSAPPVPTWHWFHRHGDRRCRLRPRLRVTQATARDTHTERGFLPWHARGGARTMHLPLFTLVRPAPQRKSVLAFFSVVEEGHLSPPQASSLSGAGWASPQAQHQGHLPRSTGPPTGLHSACPQGWQRPRLPGGAGRSPACPAG